MANTQKNIISLHNNISPKSQETPPPQKPQTIKQLHAKIDQFMLALKSLNSIQKRTENAKSKIELELNLQTRENANLKEKQIELKDSIKELNLRLEKKEAEAFSQFNRAEQAVKKSVQISQRNIKLLIGAGCLSFLITSFSFYSNLSKDNTIQDLNTNIRTTEDSLQDSFKESQKLRLLLTNSNTTIEENKIKLQNQKVKWAIQEKQLLNDLEDQKIMIKQSQTKLTSALISFSEDIKTLKAENEAKVNLLLSANGNGYLLDKNHIAMPNFKQNNPTTTIDTKEIQRKSNSKKPEQEKTKLKLPLLYTETTEELYY